MKATTQAGLLLIVVFAVATCIAGCARKIQQNRTEMQTVTATATTSVETSESASTTQETTATKESTATSDRETGHLVVERDSQGRPTSYAWEVKRDGRSVGTATGRKLATDSATAGRTQKVHADDTALTTRRSRYAVKEGGVKAEQFVGMGLLAIVGCYVIYTLIEELWNRKK